MKILIWMLLFNYIESYENLSSRQATVITQSSTFSDQHAYYAKDGFLDSSNSSCALTEFNQTKAWLQVDLGQAYSINSVKLYFRRQGDRKPYRFRQFYLDVSNLSVTQTTTSQRTRCYTDNTNAPDLPSDVITTTCQQTARFVIVETTYDAPEDEHTGAVLEICEIEIYGCGINCVDHICYEEGLCFKGCFEGYWGHSCGQRCPTGCNGTCLGTGHCSNCKSGWTSDKCENRCPVNCLGGECDMYNQRCLHGCKTGYYGLLCASECSSDCINWRCDRQSGLCLEGHLQNGTIGKCDSQEPEDANPTYQPIVYGLVVFLSFSLVLNLILVIWDCRKKMCRWQKELSETSTGYLTSESVTSAGNMPQNDAIYLELR